MRAEIELPEAHGATREWIRRVPAAEIVSVGWATRGRPVLMRRYRLVALDPSGALVRSFGARGRMTLGGAEARGQAVFRTGPRRLLAVGPDDDLEPKRIVFTTIRLP